VLGKSLKNKISSTMVFITVSLVTELPKMLTINKCNSANLLCKIYCRESLYKYRLGLKIGIEIKMSWRNWPFLDHLHSLASCNHFDSQAIKSLKGTVQTMALSL